MRETTEIQRVADRDTTASEIDALYKEKYQSIARVTRLYMGH